MAKCSSIIVSSTGQVAGTLVAENVVVDGKHDGPIQASEVTLKSKAHVLGDIRCQTIIIEKGPERSRRSLGPALRLTRRLKLPRARPSLWSKRGICREIPICSSMKRSFTSPSAATRMRRPFSTSSARARNGQDRPRIRFGSESRSNTDGRCGAVLRDLLAFRSMTGAQ